MNDLLKCIGALGGLQRRPSGAFLAGGAGDGA